MWQLLELHSYMRPWIFCCRSQVPVPLCQQFLLFWSPLQQSPSSLARCLSLAAGERKRENLPWPPCHTEKKCDQLLPSWDLEYCRQMTGPACSPALAHTLTRQENLAVSPLCGRRSSLTRGNAPTVVLHDSSSSRALLSTNNGANSMLHKIQTTGEHTTAIFLGCGITLRSPTHPSTRKSILFIKMVGEKIEPCWLSESGSLSQTTLGTTHNHKLFPGISEAGRSVTLARLYSSSAHGSSAPSCLRFGEAWSAWDSLTAVEGRTVTAMVSLNLDGLTSTLWCNLPQSWEKQDCTSTETFGYSLPENFYQKIFVKSRITSLRTNTKVSSIDREQLNYTWLTLQWSALLPPVAAYDPIQAIKDSH